MENPDSSLADDANTYIKDMLSDAASTDSKAQRFDEMSFLLKNLMADPQIKLRICEFIESNKQSHSETGFRINRYPARNLEVVDIAEDEKFKSRNKSETKLDKLLDSARARDGKEENQKPLPSLIPDRQKNVLLTQRDLKLIDASAIISGSPPVGDDMAFTHAVLCQVGLPRSKVIGDSFLRQSGAAWVSVQSGFIDEGKGPIQQPIPHGAMPRLALAWVSTYAKRHKTREVPIGNSASEFLGLLGQSATGGPRGSYTTLRKQMHALAACRLQLGYKGRTYNGQPVEQFDAWVAKDNQQKSLWPGLMVLSEGYFKELLTNGVPLDNRALFALKGSALSLDIYTWLAHRLHRIDGKHVVLHWKSLRDQFGQEYQGKEPDKDFKKDFLYALKAALAVYPQAEVKQVTGGLLLLPSPPPVRQKSA